MCSLSSTTSTCETTPALHAPQLTKVIDSRDCVDALVNTPPVSTVHEARE
jgi:hypothetical protein